MKLETLKKPELFSRKNFASRRTEKTARRRLAVECLEDRRLLAFDFGDAPAPYPVSLDENGARHEVSSVVEALGNDLSGAVSAVSHDGRTLAIGTPEGVMHSFARVFRWDGAAWQQLGEDLPANQPLEHFGKAISLSKDGNTVAIGTPTTGEGGAGALDFDNYVRVYRWTGSDWIRLGNDLHGENGLDQFGHSVSLSDNGNVLAVGAPSNNGNGRDAGHTRIYQWDGARWQRLGADIDSADAYDHFGWSVSLSSDGQTVAIGAPISPGSSVRNSELPGYAEVHRWNGSAWLRIGGQLVGEDGRDDFGWSLSLSGDGTAVAIGAPNHDGLRGHTRIYRWRESQWMQHGSDIDGDTPRPNGFSNGDQSGWSVSLSDDGNTVVIGAPNVDVPDNAGNGLLEEDVGRTRIYRATDSGWQQLGGDIDGRFELLQNKADHSGRTVSLSGNGQTLTVSGANGPTVGTQLAGRTRVFDIGTTTWRQVGDDLNPGNDHMGWSVSMSADGNTFASGAPQNDVMGDDSGHVRVFRKISGVWSARIKLEGSSAEDMAGWSVELSGDGNTLAIGEPGNGTGGNKSGQTRLYRWNGQSTFGQDEIWEPLGTAILGESEGDQSGWSVSLSFDGNTVAIGAPDNEDGGVESGQTRIYRWNGTAWNQMGADIDGNEPNERSGWSVSLNDAGNLLAIGAPNNDDNGNDAGRVRIYQWNGTTWIQQSDDFVGDNPNDQAGWSVALSGDGGTLVLGAPTYDSIGIDVGQVRVYRKQADVWQQLGNSILGERQSDQLGWSTAVNVDGSTVAIGVPGYDGRGLDAGVGQRYRWNGTVWQPIDEEPGRERGDRAGWSVALSANGNQMAVGAPFNDASGVTDAGTVLADSGVFPAMPERTNFGQAISLSDDGRTVAIGAPNHDGNGEDSGQVRVFRWDGRKWHPLGQSIQGENLTDVQVVGPDLAGWSIALSGDGNTLAIGAPLNDGNGNDSGHVRIYRWEGAAWQQLGGDIDGENWHDYFGFSVALSGDGDTVAIGAPSNDRNAATGFNGDQGQTRVYRWDRGTWQRLGGELHGEGQGDNFGWAVSLSDDGDTLAVGAPHNDGNGQNAGQARIFHWEGTTWRSMGDAIQGEQGGGASGDKLGWSVSISNDGNTVAVGAPTDGSDSSRNGYTQIHRWDGTRWLQLGDNLEGELGRSGSYPAITQTDGSGWAVSLSADGNIVAVGAPGNDSSGLEGGETRVFRWDGRHWAQDAHFDPKLQKPNGIATGGAVSINADGSVIAIGSAQYRLPIANTSPLDPPAIGLAQVFRRPPLLGVLRDSEDDGQASPDASGDGDEDDGIEFGILQGGSLANVAVTANASGLLDAWVDFNADGDWDDEGEQIFVSAAVKAGVDLLSFEVPYDAAGGVTFARFRISSNGGLSTRGLGADGEVEDYLVTINAAPTLDLLSDLTITEDAPEQTINLVGISSGGDSQPLKVTAESDLTGLVPHPSVDYQSPNSKGSISFIPTANATGSATITVTVEDGGLDANLETTADNAKFSRSFSVIVTAINDAPTLESLSDITIDEDAIEQSVNLFGISAGGGESQPLRVVAASSNTELIPTPTVAYDSADTTGSLEFTPVAQQSGIATITLTVEDGGLDGNLATPGDNLSLSRSFQVTVNSVNDSPTLNAFSNLTLDEDAVEQTVGLSGITAGGGENQPLRVTAGSSNHGLILNPSVSYTSADSTGTIKFTPVANQSGFTTITVTVEDGGLDLDLATTADNATFTRSFDVNLNAVNDPPVLAKLTEIVLDEDTVTHGSGTNLSLFASDIDSDQSKLEFRIVNLAEIDSQFEVSIGMDPQSDSFALRGDNTIHVHPASNFSGSTPVIIEARDPEGDVSSQQTFNLVINAVNDPPVLDPASDLSLSDLVEDSGSPVGQVGSLVSTLIDENRTFSNYSDIDGIAPGIAIVGKNIAIEKLWFSTDDGQNWQEVGSLSVTEALVLDADETTRLYPQALDDFSGELLDALTIKAWDQTGGYSNGHFGVDSTSDAFSSQTDTVSLTIEASPSSSVDDFYSPDFNGVETFTFSKADLFANDLLGNSESIDTVTITADAISAAGGTINVDGDQFTYTRPATWFSGIDTFSYTLDDGGSTSTATVAILSGLQGNTLTITLEPGRDHEVTLQFVDDVLIMLVDMTEETLLNIPRELVPANVDVIGAPANSNIVTFSELSNATPSETSTSWSYSGGSVSDEVAILGTGSQWAWLSTDPQVEDHVTVDLKQFTTLIESYTMIAVEKVSVGQVDRIEIPDPYLHVEGSLFELVSIQPLNLPNSTLINGGQIISQAPMVLHTAESIVGSGRIDGVFAGGVGSLIRLKGDLAIGDASSPAGFRTDGFLEVGSHTATLFDTNQASLGELTTLGDGVSPGTLISDHGLVISFTGKVEGYGTIQTDAVGTIINNGSIIGTSSEQPVTINSRVKGVGTFDNVVMNGEFTPGFSPGLWKSGTVAYTDLNRFVVELGGRLAGAEFDRVEHYLAKLGGTLDVQLIDGFKPALGDLFEVITSEQPFEGDFNEILIPLQKNGVRIRALLGQHGIALETVFDVADTLEVLKSRVDDYQIAAHDGSGLKVQGDRFRAIVTSMHQFVAEHPWHTEQLALESGKLVQIATDGVNRLIIEGSDWKNFVEPSDVNNDQNVTALDALTVISELVRRRHSDDLTSELNDAVILVTGEGHFYDQNGDGRCTPLDALRVINDLARSLAQSNVSGEGEAVTVAYLPQRSARDSPLPDEFYERASDSEFEESQLLYSDAGIEDSLDRVLPQYISDSTASELNAEAVDSLLSDLDAPWEELREWDAL